ncbi:protein-glutamate methylesterase/protein-glutamine glutaminase [Paenibacillus harenae]|uniref:protein-glutamate methylesterase/protein-glutamine glutaminase n=1 Tax=Paenibacillus harenae TaxID=306543 RepID=UPI000423B506|nr:chemotaxis response regulator protein-glutamate methylesterase [Paenibacillus harenae]
MNSYRVLVVDDSAFMRKFISDLIVQDPQFSIVATAVNGMEAIEAVREWKPDAVTLDLEMPVMNGLEALQLIMKQNPTPVIMLSGISEDHTRETIKALQYGAFDFIRKPSGVFSNDIEHVREALLEKLRIAVMTKRYQPALSIKEETKRRGDQPGLAAPEGFDAARKPVQPINPPPTGQYSPVRERSLPYSQPDRDKQAGAGSASLSPAKPNKSKSGTEAPKTLPASRSKPEVREAKPKHAEPPSPSLNAIDSQAKPFKHIVAIGTSTGGPRALHEVITALPGDFPAPVLVVQHMPPKFTKSLAQRLDSFSEMRVVEAEQGERVSAGVVYIAPGGFHLELTKDAAGYAIQLTEQPQRNGHRPSVDVLFESLLGCKELKRHAVIMTGMGSDGAKGMRKLIDHGVDSTIAEAEESCVVYGMPRAAVEAGCVNKVLPLQRIASQIVHAVLK